MGKNILIVVLLVLVLVLGFFSWKQRVRPGPQPENRAMGPYCKPSVCGDLICEIKIEDLPTSPTTGHQPIIVHHHKQQSLLFTSGSNPPTQFIVHFEKYDDAEAQPFEKQFPSNAAPATAVSTGPSKPPNPGGDSANEYKIKIKVPGGQDRDPHIIIRG